MKKIFITSVNTERFNPFGATEEELIANALNDGGLIDDATKINEVPAEEFCKLFYIKRNTYNKSTRLGNLLVKNALITSSQLQNALQYQQQNHDKRIGDILADLGFCTIDEIDQILAAQIQLRHDMEELDDLIEKMVTIKQRLKDYFSY